MKKEQKPVKLVEPEKHICEECDEEMHPFAGEGPNGKAVEGYGCDSCGWSFDV